MQRALLVSLALHALLLTAFFALPGSGGPRVPVQIYTVRIMEAPAQPQARALSLSTDAISALKLESPSLSPDAPPLPEPQQAEVPAVERLPQVDVSPPSAQPAPPGAPALPQAQQPPAAPPSSALPTLPQLPTSAPPQAPPRAAAGPAAPPAPGAEVLAPPPASAPAEPARQTPLEQLGSKVKTLHLQVETAPAAGSAAPPGTGGERNLLSLRIYVNRVREAVKEQYTFPGGFDPSLRAQLRVVLNRDGTVRSAKLVSSSGNDHFDQLVCLAAWHKAQIPPIPQGIKGDGDSLTLNVTCTP